MIISNQINSGTIWNVENDIRFLFPTYIQNAKPLILPSLCLAFLLIGDSLLLIPQQGQNEPSCKK